MNFTLKTKSIKGSKPLYKARFNFPVFFPLLQHRLTIRLWEKRTMGADRLVGSIPELAHESNVTITKIHSEGGNIKTAWVSPSISTP